MKAATCSPPVLVRYAKHGHVADRWMRVQDLLDLSRVDVLAAADDHLLEPALDPVVPALVRRAEIAGVQPARGVDRRTGGSGIVEIPRHHVVATGEDLTDRARGHRLAGRRVGDHDLD